MNQRTEKIIANYFDGKISDSEANELIAWIEKGNRDVFNEYVILNFSTEQLQAVKSDKKEMSWNIISSKINNKRLVQGIPLYKRSVFKYAAAILIFVSAGYIFLTKDSVVDNTPIIVNNNITAGTDKAILTLEDGTNITLEKGQQYTSKNVESNGKDLIYVPKQIIQTKSKPSLAYNYLTIPRGGQYFVKLSDGTQVWLNSESQLKYPVNFIEGETRLVELVYGEAYFDVSPSTNHSNSKFKVLTGIQEVEVLGTEFNIKAYQDEEYVYTTLVEGKVAVKNSLTRSQLIPGQQAIINIDTENLDITEADIYRETSWKEGVFSFRKKPLKDIMRVLARWYDMDVVFESKNLKEERFIGTLDKSQSIESILLSIKNTSNINIVYKIKNKTIYLK